MYNNPITLPAQPTPPTPPIVLHTSPSSTTLIFNAHDGMEIDDDLMDHCAQLFGENYGIWGQNPNTTRGPTPGARVKMSGRRLRQQCVAVPQSTALVVCYQRNPNSSELELIGHAFATVWDYDGGRVGWVTQLVVSLRARKRYIATSLLQMLKSRPLFRGITAIGMVSSHPSACHALSKYAGVPIQSLDQAFCKLNAAAILKDSPVDYIRSMSLRGSLFEDNCPTGAISCVYTNFYVDHREPLEALAAYRVRKQWVLGELLDGHEFLIIMKLAA